MRFHSSLLLALLAALALPNPRAPAAEPADFSGDWSTTYGPLSLRQTGARVVGQYDLESASGLIEGSVVDRRLSFSYREPSASGEGWFDLSDDSSSFDGRWRPAGETRWSRWSGQRAESPADTPADAFVGVWNTSYGPLRLSRRGNSLRGFYRMANGRFAEVSGSADLSGFSFSYDEGDAQGSGRFSIDPGGNSFSGSWQSDRGDKGAWSGARIPSKPGRLWLVVLEARWEESLGERQFAYGDMLNAYFARVQNVECRHRFFDGPESLLRAASDIPFLPEPAVVVVASHGSADGISCAGATIGADVLAQCFSRAHNLALLHFSSCLVMAGSFPRDLAKLLPPDLSFPISGYAASVDWGASAAAEFLYLDLVLARGLEPADAADRLLELVPIAGDSPSPNSPFEPLEFRFRP